MHTPTNFINSKESILDIRPATKDKASLILKYINALAQAEAFPFAISVTQQDIENNLFSDKPDAHAIICYENNQPCGFAVYYFTFSTTTGQRGLHLDDLYIEPNVQGKGYGKQVMVHLANLAKSNHCARFEWWALKTNVSAIKFYQKIGAQSLDQISIFRLDSTNIINLINDKN